MAKFRPIFVRAALLLAVAVSSVLVTGCNSGPHQQPPSTSATTRDAKDSLHHPVGNSGPHQGG